MRGDFQHEYKHINGISGDSAIYLSFPSEALNMLFDLGMLENLSNKELLKVSHAFVSHTHIDHFIGFDRLLRVNIPHFRTLTLTGPTGFIENVYSKLKGYTWNLLEKDQLTFIVKEISESGALITAKLSNNSSFTPEIIEKQAFENPIVTVMEFTDNAHVSAAILDHRTDSIAYCYHAPKRYQVKMDAIELRGWRPGPWIRDLQIAVNQKRFDDLIKPKNLGEVFKVKDLSEEILIALPHFSLGYLTDLAFSKKNIETCRKLFSNVSLLMSEAVFTDKDIHRAVAKQHLTTKQAALIAATCQTKQLEIHHISGIYGEENCAVKEEALSFFNDYCSLSFDELQLVLEEEIMQVASLKMRG